MKKIFILLLILLQIQLIAQDSLRISAELNKAKTTYLTKLDSSIIYARNVVQWSDQIADDWQKAWGLKMVGVYHQMRREIDSAMYYFGESLVLFENESDTLEIGKSNLSLGQMNIQRGFFDIASRLWRGGTSLY